MDPNSTDPNNNKVQPDLSSIIPPGTTQSPTPQAPENPTPTYPQSTYLTMAPDPTPIQSDPTPTWPNTTTPSIPTFLEPSPIPTTNLDNPMNVPSQTPTIDGGLSPIIPTQSESTPTFMPHISQPTDPNSFSPTDSNYPPVQPQPTDTNISWTPPQSTTPMSSVEPNPTLTPQDLYAPSQPEVSQPISEIPTQSIEQAPTDLSHLIPDPEDTNSVPVYTPPISQPETLIAPADGNEVTPNIPMEETKGKMPKWVIGVGIGLFLAVVAASAYLILGVGQNTEVPSTEVSQPVVVPTTPIPAQPVVVPPATGSASFGSLNGASPTPQATSAADLIRQRQQQR